MINLLSSFPIYTSISPMFNLILVLCLIAIIVYHAYRYLSIAGKDNNYNADDTKIPMGNQLSNFVYVLVIFKLILSGDSSGMFGEILYYLLVLVFAVQTYMLVMGIFLQLTKFNFKDLYSNLDKKQYKETMLKIREHRFSALILLIVSTVLSRILVGLYGKVCKITDIEMIWQDI